MFLCEARLLNRVCFFNVKETGNAVSEKECWSLYSYLLLYLLPGLIFRFSTVCPQNVFLCFFARFNRLAKSDYWLRYILLSVCPHGTNRLPVGRFLWNLMFEDFSKIYGDNSILIKILSRRPMCIYDNIWLTLLKMRLCRENRNTFYVQ